MPRGVLRIYLGSAPGVGKTFAMLDEGWRRKERGADVVIGLVETHGRANTLAQIRDLEIIPRRVVAHRDVMLEEMDLESVIGRRPDVVLVDELAHTNVPGSRHDKRWQDVEEILDAGIDVISTVNVQHLESLNDVVERITGVTQRETVPDAIVRAADQVELVDMSPEALRRRMAHGNIYPAERVDAALANYFRPGNLGALRELALLWVADRVEESLQSYLTGHGITETWETRERVVVAITGAPGNEHLIRRAARMAGRLQGELVGVHVIPADGLAERTGQGLESQRGLVVQLGGSYREIVGDDTAATLASFARTERATQVVLGAAARSRWREALHGSLTTALLRQLSDVDIHVIAAAEHGSSGGASLFHVRPSTPIPPARRRWAWLLCIVGLPALTMLLAAARDQVSLGSELVLSLALVMVVAALGGLRPGLAASVVAFFLTNWFFVPPLHTLAIKGSDNIVTLVVFIAVAAFVSVLVDRAAVRTRESLRARAEARALARATGTLVGASDPLPELVDQLRLTFDARGVSVIETVDGGWRLHAGSGDVVPMRPDDGLSFALDAEGTIQLVLAGAAVTADDHAVLHAFADQLRLALESRQLRLEAESFDALAASDALRTALLRAVSHDLRTPLASIKASATGLLLQDDVSFSDDDRIALLHNIDSAADRLDRLVGNLLDMSRLQAGAVETLAQPVALEEVVAAALSTVESASDRVDVEVDESLPLVMADGALLERALANIVSNALAWSPASCRVRVQAGRAGARVDLLVVDRGPGIPRASRERIFEPFQRLGDRSNDAGAGLGLAIARGFIETMGATLEVDDTPGGGTTMTIHLQAASPPADP